MIRYSLRCLLLTAILIGIGVGYLLKPRTAIDALDEYMEFAKSIDRWSGVEFEEDIRRLDPLLVELGQPIPEELRAFIRYRTPKRTFWAGANLLSIDELYESFEQGVPDKCVWRCGFYLLMRDGDGSAIAYCLDDKKIYNVGFINEGDLGAATTAELIKAHAGTPWPSLAAFFDDRLAELKRDLQLETTGN